METICLAGFILPLSCLASLCLAAPPPSGSSQSKLHHHHTLPGMLRQPILFLVGVLCLAAVLVAGETRRRGVDECSFCPEGGECTQSAGCTKSCSATSLSVNRKEWFLGGDASVGSSEDGGLDLLRRDIRLRKRPEGTVKNKGRGSIITNEDLSIDCRVTNGGAEDQRGVEVALVSRPWGLNFHTGPLGVCLNGTCAARSVSGAGIIGITTVDIPAGSEVLVQFSHSFDSTAFTGLEVRVNRGSIGGGTGSGMGTVQIAEGAGDGVGGGEGSEAMPFELADSSSELVSSFVGDSPTDVGCVDKAGSNLDIVHAFENASYRLPMVNDGDQPALVRPVFRCRGLNDADFGTCTNVLVFMPALDNGTVWIPARGEVYAEIRAFELGEESVEVAFFGQNVETGEVEQAVLELVGSSVESLLNRAHLCCIKSVRLRVLLEAVLVSILVLYEQGELYKAAMLARQFIRKVKAVLCDALSSEEQGCLERALIPVLDAARMMTAAALGADEDLASTAGATQVEPGKARALGALHEGDDLRRQGLYEEAVLKYARRNSRASLGRRESLRALGAAGPGSPATMLSGDGENPLYKGGIKKGESALYQGR